MQSAQTLKNKFYIKQNDVLPVLSIGLIKRGCLGNREPFCLSGVTGITFTMVNSEGSVQIAEAPASIICYSGGSLGYNWQVGDTSMAGHFLGTFNLYFATGQKMSLPQISNIDVLIGKDINPFD